uniref:Anaphase-promoting complex subunit 2 TPR repeats domain-containing protein n=1 Tax=Ditylum brightwellii TaxID=49249 RepID=A0A7S4UVG3_9STRA
MPMMMTQQHPTNEKTLQYIENIKNRSSTIEADKFFSNDNKHHHHHHHDMNEEEDDEEEWKSLPNRLAQLRDYLQQNNDTNEQIYEFSSDPFEARRIALTAAIFARSSPTFLSSFQKLFSATLSARQQRWEAENEEEEDDAMEEEDELGFDELDLYDSLRTLGWIHTKLSRPLGEAIHQTIYTAVQQKIAGEYEDSTLFTSIMSWKDSVVVPWVQDVISPTLYTTLNWDRTLDYAASECFCEIRIKEIFDIVADYPDSLPAIRELAQALDRTRMHGKLAVELRKSLKRRLIHPGANTSQIIDVYINTIKVFREIDPSDELLEAVVAEPGVRSYLRGRSDTVRCIITSLTDEEAGDLYEELRKHDARLLEEAQVDSDDEEDTPDFDWQPAPSIHKQHGALGGRVTLNRKSGAGDILAMLVGIYGSKELFVNEYRVMLADKLLANLGYDTDKEVHNLELLKLRFGEISMRQCEIMIKDYIQYTLHHSE